VASSAWVQAEKRELAKLLRKAGRALHLNEHIDEPGDVVFRPRLQARLRGYRGRAIRSGRSKDWLKKAAPSVTALG
jgi:hypothetical protein